MEKLIRKNSTAGNGRINERMEKQAYGFRSDIEQAGCASIR